jgi:lysophospholipase L1-like esterase
VGDRSGPKRLAEASGKLCLVLFSSLLALLGAELAVRWLAGPLPSDVGHHQLLCEHDPLLGWRKIPNARKRYTTVEFDVEEHINAKGLRGPEYAYEKNPGLARVLVLGDSFTEGYTVDFEDVFTEVLARRLQQTSTTGGYEVINAGTGGYSTDQELLYFRSEGHRYAPDLIVVSNDVWYNAQAAYPRASKPLFALRDGELTLTHTPVPKPPPKREVEARPAARTPWGRVKLMLDERSRLYRFIRDRTRNTHWAHAAAIRFGLAEAPASGAIPLPDGWQILKTNPPESVGKAWELTEALLLALRADVARSGGRLLVVKIPSSFELYERQWKAVRAKHGLAEEEWDPSIATERLRRICARHGIELLNLVPIFASAIADGLDRDEPLYYPLDRHWTASGHRLAGESLADYIAGPRPAEVR